VDPQRDHLRGGRGPQAVSVVIYGDYLCPYCRRLTRVLERLRQVMGERLSYVFRHSPNDRANPGATLASQAAEAADRQGRFWDMHDALYRHEAPLSREHVLEIARSLGLDMSRFCRDLQDEAVQRRIEEDRDDGERNGVAGTPTIFVDGVRYDGAWDFYSMLEALERPIAAQVKQTARAFANLPASAALVLLIAAATALALANSPLAPGYHAAINTPFGLGLPAATLSLTLAGWCSEGLLAIFFLLVGLEIRREVTVGALADRRAAILPVVAAIGGVVAPAIIFLALNRGPTAQGWGVATATDIAFALGVLALMGERVPLGIRVFVAALAVVDDVLSVLTLAVFYAHAFEPAWMLASVALSAMLVALKRARVYAGWPYVAVAVALWVSFHSAGVHAALTGIVLAVCLPTRPPPAASPLLAQAATALAALEQAEKEPGPSGADLSTTPASLVRDWSRRNLMAASERLMSPAERVERALAPWAAYVALPLFAFSAAGVPLQLDLHAPYSPRLLAGVILGLVVGKPLGICLASLLAVKAKIGVAPQASVQVFVGAACVCGIGDTVAILLADQAFPAGPYAAIAKVGVLIGSVIAAVVGTAVILTSPAARTPPVAPRLRRPAEIPEKPPLGGGGARTRAKS
jgi:NhaA family Na+:H+ antiporter